jgi:hypothetical protein
LRSESTTSPILCAVPLYGVLADHRFSSTATSSPSWTSEGDGTSSLMSVPCAFMELGRFVGRTGFGHPSIHGVRGAGRAGKNASLRSLELAMKSSIKAELPIIFPMRRRSLPTSRHRTETFASCFRHSVGSIFPMAAAEAVTTADSEQIWVHFSQAIQHWGNSSD